MSVSLSSFLTRSNPIKNPRLRGLYSVGQAGFQQGTTTPIGSGSWAEGLARAAQAGLGGYFMGKAGREFESQQEAAATAKKKEEEDKKSALASMLVGSVSKRTGALLADPLTRDAGIELGLAELGQQPAGPVKLGASDRLVDPATGTELVGAAPQMPQTKTMRIGDQIVQVGPGGTAQPIYTAPRREQAQQRPIAINPGQTLFDPITNQPVFTAPQAERPAEPSAFDRALQSAQAKEIVAGRDRAASALEAASVAENAMRLLDEGVYAGPLADERYALGRMVLGSDNPQVARTGEMMATMAQMTLRQAEALKGVLSDKDMALLAQAAGGNLSMGEQALRSIFGKVRDASVRTVERFNQSIPPGAPVEQMQVPGYGQTFSRTAPPPPPGFVPMQE